MKKSDKVQYLHFKRRMYRTENWVERKILCSYNQQKAFFRGADPKVCMPHATAEDIEYLLNSTVLESEFSPWEGEPS